jgi:hypothetical protein
MLLLSWVVVLAASCGRTAHDVGEKPAPSQSAGEASHGLPPSQAGSGTSSAGAPPTIDPIGVTRPCAPSDAPGEPCDGSGCWGRRCGVRFDLTCKGGTWDSGPSVLAWQLACPVPGDSVHDIGDIEQGACCAEVLPRNDVYSEPPSCDLCPQAAPQDGEPCSLPAECAPPMIDCFYKCCCYGSLTWAQCDGERWHVATNCSSK